MNLKEHMADKIYKNMIIDGTRKEEWQEYFSERINKIVEELNEEDEKSKNDKYGKKYNLIPKEVEPINIFIITPPPEEKQFTGIIQDTDAMRAIAFSGHSAFVNKDRTILAIHYPDRQLMSLKPIGFPKRYERELAYIFSELKKIGVEIPDTVEEVFKIIKEYVRF